MGSDGFAAPLLEFMRYYEDQARARMLQENTEVSYPLTQRCLLPRAWDVEGVALEDVLPIHPPDSNLEVIGDGWATDNLLDMLISDDNSALQKKGCKSYIAPTSATNMFVRRDTFDHGKVIEHLEKKLAQAENYANNGCFQYEDIFPASGMPTDSQSLSFVYNVAGNHWIHVNMRVNEQKTVGSIRVYDSRRNARRAERTFQEVAQEVVLLAKIVSKRPELGWQNVVWQQGESKECPQQENTSDCGFGARFCALAIGAGSEATSDTLRASSAKKITKALRWATLRSVSKLVLNREPSSAPPQERSSRMSKGRGDEDGSKDHRTSE